MGLQVRGLTLCPLSYEVGFSDEGNGAAFYARPRRLCFPLLELTLRRLGSSAPFVSRAPM